ncbi:bifunctional diguanylate cyclase/phosphodiesterase [Micromonospora sp. PPF5-17]|uniref:Bifunctional diguanylate cyclase/phosphodiesterase n=2 Tax=Micromonosporaceae TaxID=28056 RepID=A0ABX9WG72_9ACTN|nr:bifunctional diguanylate cyclase/phosphodiesterase [Micromonospora sp. PPF5-17B]NES37764.1 bifunctional diguanylate cyclase/phosphodiesterase [Micromonospora solifontis]NES54184.1 bifunctional diguanylate cyclase/phosphodiesterase [Micromonospora sp. PPF5-6]RNL97960.1 bifunctional diguanylate cyclase/phosphodiesterase [Micromonospora solifontis]
MAESSGAGRSCPGAFARAWAKAVSGTSYLPMTQAQLEALLQRLTGRLAAAIQSEPFDLRIGQQVGAELVQAHIASAEGLGRTVEVIQLRLVRDLGLVADDVEDRMARLLATVATGYARALRDRTLDEQESIRRAAMMARAQAERALRESEARFRHQATHDPLTDLPNRTLFTERLAAAIAGADRVGVCFLDLDRFKVVNDSLGHQIGDLLLVSVAQRLRRALGEHLVARLGGDEFVILVESTAGTDDAVRVAEAALAAVSEPALVDGHELTVSASIGIVERPAAGTSPMELMRAADSTLHWAKAAGGARWSIFDADRNRRELARYALSAAIPAALDRGEFYLDYQPLTSLRDGRVLGMEALVRWRHPELGVLRPDSFIGLAEETGLIVRLGAWVLAEACREARGWADVAGDAPFVSVNLAVQQVRRPGLVDEVRDLLRRTGLPPGRLQLEITESTMMSTAEEPVRALRVLADLGVRIAIDDFGTGYCNLAYLRDLPVTELKVAGEFVTGLRAPADDPASRTDERILASLVSLAHALKVTVTAEGVETAEQAERLRAIGCDAAQGWHFGRPGPARQHLDRSPALTGTTV